MASEKKPKGDLSRRDFIKRTTAATAAASVGVVSSAACGSSTSPQVAPAPPPKSWSITGREIQTFWTEIHPKIIALSWLVPQYRGRFESKNDIDFRWKEAQRIAQAIAISCPTSNTYTSDIDILVTDPANLGMSMQEQLNRIDGRGLVPCPDSIYNVYGDKFFMINEYGFIMPWPEDPSPGSLDPGNVFIAYFQGGGVLPGDLQSLPQTQRNAYAAIADEISNNNKWTPSTNPPRQEPVFDYRGLSGVALLALLEKWSKMIALAWHSPTHRADIRGNPEKYIMPEVWTQWPRDHIRPIVVDTNLHDFRLSYDGNANGYIKMEVPLPPPVANDDDIFVELVMGFATNPLYTNTY